MPQNAVIIDAATRFLRSNPELFQVASRGAGQTGQAIDDLLADVIRRMRSSALEAVAKEQVVVGPPHRSNRRSQERIRSRGPSVDDSRPRLFVVSSGDAGRDRQEELLNGTVR